MDRESIEERIQKLREADCCLDNEFAAVIDVIEGLLCNSEYKVAVIGEFSAGKSTFINALIGKRLLYSSAKEATGAVTTLRSGETACARAYDKEGNTIEEFSVDSQEGIRKLTDYLDIRNDHSAGCVDIMYPLEGIDSDIVFMDTPGIEKMSKEQIKLTRKAMEDANAIIFLVKKEGFTQQSLNILAGEDDDIGRIHAGNVFVVMTRIGEVYHDRSWEEADEKIKELRAEVRNQLSEIGLADLPVFTLDSRDYLWGKDEELYREARREGVERNFLSQEEYIERSNFDEFKEKLRAFLDRDERVRNVRADIDSRINRLAEEMLRSVQEKSSRGQNNLEIRLERLNDNIQVACQGRDKFYKQIKRLLDNYLLEFEERIVRDIEAEKRKGKRYAQVIEEIISSSPENLTQSQVDKCLKQVEEDDIRFSHKIQRIVNEQKEIFASQYVKKVFAGEFDKFFMRIGNMEPGITLEEYKDMQLNIKPDGESFDIEQDKILDDMEKEIRAARDEIKEQKKRLYAASAVQEDLERYKKELADMEQKRDQELAALGRRPGPKQKYKTVQRTKGILFWKEPYTEKIMDGLDYSPCYEWDRKNRLLEDRYGERIEQIRQKMEKTEEQMRRLAQTRTKLERTEKELCDKEERKDKMKKQIALRKKENQKRFLDRKKEEIFVACNTQHDNMIQMIEKGVMEYLYQLRAGVRKDIDDKAKQFIEKYRKELIKESEKISKSHHMIRMKSSDLIDEIKSIITEG